MKKKVLVVDDSEIVLSKVKQDLTTYGLEVNTCIGWGRLSTVVGQFQPDLILMDVNMPGGLQGDKLVGILKKQKPHLKMVFHSGKSASELDAITKETGADGYIEKTDNRVELFRKVKRFLT